MKIKQLLTKTLLVAVGLLVGTSAVWADDYYNITRYSQDYEDGTNYDAGWSFGGGDHSQQTANNSKYLQMSLNKNKSTVTNSLSFASNSYFTDATDYQFSFDFGYGSGNANQKPTSLILKGKNGVTLFMFKNSADQAWGSDLVLTDGADNNLGTYTATYKTISNPFLNIVVTGNSTNGVKLTVNNNGTKIADDVKIADFTTIESIEIVVTGGASIYGFDNMILKEHSDVAVAQDPTFALSSVSGDDRIYTITNPNGEGTLYYTTTSADAAPVVGDAAYSSTTENSIDVTYATGTYYAYTVLDDGTTTSKIVSQAVVGGAITLITPKWTKTAYDKATATSSVTLTADESSLTGSPTATIYYNIDGGADTKYTSAISIKDGEILSYYAAADGYTNSPIGSVTAKAPCDYPDLWNETYNNVVSSNSDFSLGATAVTTVNTVDYFNLYYNGGETLVSENLLANNVGSNYMLRANGLYPGGSWNLAIPNLKVGDYVTFNGITGNAAFEITGNSTDVTADDWNSTKGAKYCFVVKKEGTSRFTMARYGYIQSISVKRAPIPVTVTTAGYATYVNNDYDLDFSATSIKAYKVKVTSKGKATMTQVDNVPAGTPVLLYKEDGATEDIPVMTGAAAVSDNDLVAGTGAAVATTDGAGNTNMILNNGGGKVGFYFAAGQTVATNRAYLHFDSSLDPESSAPMMLVFDNETTGINEVKGEGLKVNGYYDLQGRKVAQPTKGLYIVNGKKVVIK